MKQLKVWRKQHQSLLQVILVWGGSLLWIAAIPGEGESFKAEEKTEHKLAHVRRLITEFESDYGHVPASLTKLRAYGRIKAFSVSSYDAFGVPLEYVRLDHKHYILRSFGASGGQATLLSSPTQSALLAEPLPPATPIYRFHPDPEPNLFPSVFSSGADSPNREWYARIYTNPEDGKRRLMVRHRRRDQFFMMAHHDFVEEFFWLPSSYRIVYTASSSSRYQDGIYLWDLLDDTTQNLLHSGLGNVAPGAQSLSDYWYLSISGYDIRQMRLHVFAYPDYNQPLDPLEFYSTANLYAISIPERKGQAHQIELAMPQDGVTALDFFRSHSQNLVVPDNPSLEQAAWLNLSFDGSAEETIDSWQSFAEQYYRSPLFSYALWYLGSLYSDLYRDLSKNADSSQASIARSYASEYFLALSLNPLAPSYLRGLAKSAKYTLAEGQPLEYRISRVAVKP